MTQECKRLLTADPLDINIAKDHLNSGTSSEYLLGNNRGDSTDISLDVNRLSALRKYLANPSRVVTVGIGGGLELNALHHMFHGDTKVIGVELSQNVIEYARRYLAEQQVDAEIIEGSATDLPFRREGIEVDGLLLSYVLHEIYSYFPNGKSGWEKSIQDAAQSLSENGILLIQDFAAPEFKGDVEIGTKSPIAYEFYNYFRTRYRTFSNLEENKRKKMISRRSNLNDFPILPNEMSQVKITLDRAAELMLHFRNYLRQPTIVPGGDPNWKEIDECYLPELGTNGPLTPNEYLTRITEVGSNIVYPDGFKMICVQYQLSDRLSTAKLLNDHFRLSMGSQPNSLDLFNEITRKAEYVFQKVRVN